MSTAVTFTFGEVFPTYKEWQSFITQYQVFDYTQVGAHTVAFDQYCYKLLSRQYWGQNIRYSDVNAFCRALANVYENRFNQFQQQSMLIQKAYGVTAGDLEVLNESIAAAADNPNTKPADPWEPLEYVSAQTRSRVKNNKLRAYLDAINSMPSLRINEFLRGRREYADEIGFIDLFMQVIPNITYMYDKEV